MFVEISLIKMVISSYESFNTLMRGLAYDVNNMKLLVFTTFLPNHILWIDFAGEYCRDKMSSSLLFCK